VNKPNPIELQKYLSGVDYPAKRDDLVRAAERNGADDTTLQVVRGQPPRVAQPLRAFRRIEPVLEVAPG
jgi:uncharacterized protein DUF2795